MRTFIFSAMFMAALAQLAGCGNDSGTGEAPQGGTGGGGGITADAGTGSGGAAGTAGTAGNGGSGGAAGSAGSGGTGAAGGSAGNSGTGGDGGTGTGGDGGTGTGGNGGTGTGGDGGTGAGDASPSGPEPPVMKSVSPMGGGLHVTWTHVTSDCTGTELDRNKDGGTYALATTLAGDATSYHDSSASGSGEFCYRARCRRGQELSADSAEKCASK